MTQRRYRPEPTRWPGVFRLEDGRLMVRARATDRRTGKEREAERTLTPDATEADALARLAALKTELREGGTPAPVHGPRTTLRSYVKSWLERRVARLRPSSADRYADALAFHVLPRLGDLDVRMLTRADVEAWVAWAQTATWVANERARNARIKKRLEPPEPKHRLYSHDTLTGWWRVLVEVLRDLAADYQVPDPTARVSPPQGVRESRREQRTLTPAELGRLLAAVADKVPERHAELVVLALTGMRPGELYALTWDQVDLQRGVLKIDRAHWRGAVGPTKTRKTKWPPLLPEVIEILKAHRAVQLRGQAEGLELGLVFPSDAGTHRTPGSPQKALDAACEAAEIDIHVTPLVLRRTLNTSLLREQVGREVVRSILGHTTDAMTDRYSGPTDGDRKAAMIKVVRKLRPEEGS